MMKKKFSNSVGSVTLDIGKLIAIERQLAKKHFVQVGVLGNTSYNRKETVDVKNPKLGQAKHKKGKNYASDTNAEIGFLHEFGSRSRNIPARSWLRAPLFQSLQKEAVKYSKVFFNHLTNEKFVLAYKKLAILAENVIQRAFATHGPEGKGKWAPNAPLTIAKKGSSAPLIDTAQLRKAVTSKVVTR